MAAELYRDSTSCCVCVWQRILDSSGSCCTTCILNVTLFCTLCSNCVVPGATRGCGLKVRVRFSSMS